MGEDIKRWQNEQFRHRQDKSFCEFRAKDLFSDRPEVFSRSITCTLKVGTALEADDQLVASAAEGRVEIRRNGFELVGESDDATLREVVDACNGIHRVDLDETSSLLGVFTVRVRCEDEP